MHLMEGGASPWASLPFGILLLVLLLIPSRYPVWWARWSTALLGGGTLAFFGLLCGIYGVNTVGPCAGAVMAENYIPFLLTFSILYFLTSSITLDIRGVPTPLFQTLYLLVGTLLASILGTLGASMILIHPLLHLNAQRVYKAHTLVLFIFLVCNIGGGLSPLGDAPLLMGFLKGVPFMWPLQHLWPSVALMAVPLLMGYWVLDSFLYRQEKALSGFKQTKDNPPFSLRLTGLPYCVGVLGVLGAMIYMERLDLWTKNSVLSIILGGIIILFYGRKKLFSLDWLPLRDIAVTFLALFIGSIPLIDQLSVGGLSLVLQNIRGPYEPVWAFWGAGLLSGILDNTPTYVLWFQSLGGVKRLVSESSVTLIGLSVGSVFMGALTYIGNAPNLLVQHLAQKSGVIMPTSLQYLGWALICLLPGFLGITFWILWP